MAKAYRDLREFLATLEEEGQLVRVTDEVNPEPTIGAAGRAASRDASKGPAILFENIAGYKGTVATNVHGSWANHALMMGMSKDATTKQQFEELNRRWDLYPVPATVVSREEAPCKENVVTEDINLFEILPLYRINSNDGGCYLSKASIITAHPDNHKEHNVGCYRLQVKDKDRLGIQLHPAHDGGRHMMVAEARMEPLPIAIALGVDPIVSFMASTPIAPDQNEYDFVGALRGGVPTEIVAADTAPHLFVPATSEVVIEGYVVPGVREIEGPFGEFPGSYSGARRQYEVQITRVTHRTDPIFENLYLGMPWTEIDFLMALNTSVPVYKQVKKDIPGVEAINAMYTHGIGEIISVKSSYGGQAKAAALRLLSTPHGAFYAKIVILVDEFVDPFDLNQVMWALTTRVVPDRDVTFIPNSQQVPLDPSSLVAGINCKMIIDATTPVAPEPNPRPVKLLDEPVGTEQWIEFINNYRKTAAQ